MSHKMNKIARRFITDLRLDHPNEPAFEEKKEFRTMIWTWVYGRQLGLPDTQVMRLKSYLKGLEDPFIKTQEQAEVFLKTIKQTVFIEDCLVFPSFLNKVAKDIQKEIKKALKKRGLDTQGSHRHPIDLGILIQKISSQGETVTADHETESNKGAARVAENQQSPVMKTNKRPMGKKSSVSQNSSSSGPTDNKKMSSGRVLLQKAEQALTKMQKEQENVATEKIDLKETPSQSSSSSDLEVQHEIEIAHLKPILYASNNNSLAMKDKENKNPAIVLDVTSWYPNEGEEITGTGTDDALEDKSTIQTESEETSQAVYQDNFDTDVQDTITEENQSANVSTENQLDKTKMRRTYDEAVLDLSTKLIEGRLLKWMK